MIPAMHTAFNLADQTHPVTGLPPVVLGLQVSGWDWLRSTLFPTRFAREMALQQASIYSGNMPPPGRRFFFQFGHHIYEVLDNKGTIKKWSSPEVRP